MKKIYLVDTENVHSVWIRLLSSLGADDEMVLFYTNNSQGLSYSDLDALQEGKFNFKMVKCFTGRNGLDFQLSSYLGYLIKGCADSEFYIIANDNGYDALVRFWNKQGILVKRLTVDAIKKRSIEEPIASEDTKGRILTAETTVTIPAPTEPETQSESEVEFIKELEPVTITVEAKNSYSPILAEPVRKETPGKKTDSFEKKIVSSEKETDSTEKKGIHYKVMNPLWGELQASKKASVASTESSDVVSTSSSSNVAVADDDISKQEKPESKSSKAKTDKKKNTSTKKTVSKAEDASIQAASPSKKKSSAGKAASKAEPASKKGTAPVTEAVVKEEPVLEKKTIKNKTKALTIIKDACKDCSFKLVPKDFMRVLEILAFEVPDRDLRTINNRLVKSFEQQYGSELYKTLKQAKAITEVYKLID